MLPANRTGQIEARGTMVMRGYYADTAASATSWTDRTNPAVTTANLYAVTKGPGRHVAVGQGGTVITSDDGGATWTTQSSGFNSTLYDVAWTGTDYVAVGYSGAILTSDDAVTWSMYTTR